MLAAAGWVVQDYSRANLSAARGVAVREVVLAPLHGRADDPDSTPRATSAGAWGHDAPRR
jgi:hypothetical protein